MKHFFLSAILLAACGPTEAEVGAAGETEATSSARLATAEATITFRSDWNIVRNGLFIEGGRARIQYDAARLPGCRGDQNGKPAWSITGYARVNDGPVQSFEAGGYSPSNGTQEPVIQLPAAGRVAFWFQITNVWGCSAWDSNYGKNFVFEVAPQPRIVFDRAWNETVIGTPGTAPGLVIDYDLERLPNCRAQYAGQPAWDIVVYWRFDGGQAQYKAVTKVVNTNQRVSTPTTLELPTGAREVELWFMASDRAGCTQWDSDYGKNYRWRVN